MNPKAFFQKFEIQVRRWRLGVDKHGESSEETVGDLGQFLSQKEDKARTRPRSSENNFVLVLVLTSESRQMLLYEWRNVY